MLRPQASRGEKGRNMIQGVSQGTYGDSLSSLPLQRGTISSGRAKANTKNKTSLTINKKHNSLNYEEKIRHTNLQLTKKRSQSLGDYYVNS